MKDDEVAKILKYLSEFRKDVDRRFDEVDIKFDKVYNHLDNIEKALDIDESERLVMSAQLDRTNNAVEKHEVRISKLEKRAA